MARLDGRSISGAAPRSKKPHASGEPSAFVVGKTRSMHDDRLRGCCVIFESHATSLDNEAELASGWFDTALSTTGNTQAHALGVRRRHDPLAVVFCSDLIRARRTAEIAFADRGLSIISDARLRECDYGVLTRRPVSELDAVRVSHVTEPFPGGESYEQVVSRVAAWLEETESTFRGETVLVVGHRATFYALEHLFHDIPLRQVVSAPYQWQAGRTYRKPDAYSRSSR